MNRKGWILLLVLLLMAFSAGCSGQNQSSQPGGNQPEDTAAVQEDDQPDGKPSTEHPADFQEAASSSQGRAANSDGSAAADTESQAALDETLRTLDELESVVNSLDEVSDEDLTIPD